MLWVFLQVQEDIFNLSASSKIHGDSEVRIISWSPARSIIFLIKDYGLLSRSKCGIHKQVFFFLLRSHPSNFKEWIKYSSFCPACLMNTICIEECQENLKRPSRQFFYTFSFHQEEHVCSYCKNKSNFFTIFFY